MIKQTTLLLKIVSLLAVGLMAVACSPVLPEPFLNPLESRLILQVPFFSDTRGAGGPAALASVMTYVGHPVTAEEVILHLGEKTPSPNALAVFARQEGEQKASLSKGTPELLLEAVRKNKPLIVRLGLLAPLLDTGDYAVVVGFTPDGPVLNSGDVQQQIIPWGDFLKSWHEAKNLIIQINPE